MKLKKFFVKKKNKKKRERKSNNVIKEENMYKWDEESYKKYEENGLSIHPLKQVLINSDGKKIFFFFW